MYVYMFIVSMDHIHDIGQVRVYIFVYVTFTILWNILLIKENCVKVSRNAKESK